MSIEERREREKTHRRRTILESAERLFFEKGYERTRMTEIAEDCELSKGTLYLYFRNKEDLAHGVLVRSFDVMIDFIGTAAERAKTGREKLIAMLEAFGRFYRESTQHFYLSTVLEGQLGPIFLEEDSVPEYVERIAHIRTMITEAIQLGVHDSSIRSAIDLEVAPVAYMEVVFGFYKEIFMHGCSLEKRIVPLDRLVEELNTLLINSLT